MSKIKGRRAFSLNYLFASFFGAFMIASTYAYYNYRFSQYKFIDFNKWTFYEKKDTFLPTKEYYTVLVYSSNIDNVKDILPKLSKKNVILAIDLYQHDRKGYVDGVRYMSAGMNTLLPLIHRFNVYVVPSAFRIKKSKDYRYKQDSRIMAIE